MRKWFPLVLAVIVIIITLLAVELVVSLAAPQRLLTEINAEHPEYEPFNTMTDFGIMPEPYSEGYRYGERNQKIWVKHNSQGFRSDDEYYLVPGKTNVALFGDSRVYGFGNDQDETIGTYIQEQLGDSFNVMNFGVPGWNLDQEFLLYMYLALNEDFKADINVFFIHPNDLSLYLEEFKKPLFMVDNVTDFGFSLFNYPVKYPKEDYELDMLADKDRRSRAYKGMDPLHRFMLRHSHAYTFFNGFRHRFKRMDATSEDDVNLAPFRLDAEHIYKKSYRHLCLLSQRMRLDIETVGSRVIFVYVPADFQVDEKALEEADKYYYNFDPDNFDMDKMNTILDDCWEGADYVDLTPVFRQKAKKTRLYNTFLGHWTPEGAELAAGAVAGEILTI
ncbi:MAG: SGNH/GDSL hydrolase family protein [Nanoarchaeota archaeon]|nr:SGNH/GDSL hydrolase family protein [Nanoarchaeota archaeon]